MLWAKIAYVAVSSALVGFAAWSAYVKTGEHFVDQRIPLTPEKFGLAIAIAAVSFLGGIAVSVYRIVFRRNNPS